jgi:hypothetical protein
MFTIIWATNKAYENEWERDWLTEIFNSLNIKYTIINLTKMTQIVKNALIVLNHNINYVLYLQQYEDNSVPFGVIHLSDERVHDNMDFYKYSMCKFIFRNYYHPRYLSNNVQFFALGYKKQFWKDSVKPDLISHSIRKYIWSFAGTPKHKRETTLELFQSLQPNKIVWEYGDSFGIQTTGLKTPDYRELMLNSSFIICLEGWISVDSFRTCEALECGCIPVVRDCFYWKSLFNKMPPFIISDSWQENFDKIQKLSAEEIEAIRIKCVHFWSEYKTSLKTNFREVVTSTIMN